MIVLHCLALGAFASHEWNEHERREDEREEEAYEEGVWAGELLNFIYL